MTIPDLVPATEFDGYDELEPEGEGLEYQIIMLGSIIAFVIAPRLIRFVPAVLALAGVLVALGIRY